ncbi:Predicted dehydrogenase [Nakamurella panacisegetis]|uniref:Predicted dehydrogenase n=1 Tax=Nakamurella panacisegetis TaxID=1090615 RepID=A0A1H0RR02_9ACTN|nr:Gfo/Idh/MocA family oxidoreductase [Nakamurella panacisegetis]SDP31830.1 Predicted dehydrogenase [Nakamurella panacisegetis]
MTIPPVRWALVGYGSGGRVFHAPMLAGADGVELVAVVTGDPGRRAEVADRLPSARAVSDLTELPDLGVAAVTITTPPATHTDLAHRALDLGLDVVVDKPFALTEAAARRLVDHARDAGRMLTVYQNRRWDTDFLTVRRLIADGRLGRVHRFVSRIDRLRPVRPGWATAVSTGGGTLLDLGPHLIDQALQLFGPVARLHAQLRAIRPGSGAEDEVELHLEHAGGVFSTIAAGMASAAEGPRLQVNGDRGGYLVDGFDVQEAQLKSGASPRTLGDAWGVEPPSGFGRLTTADGTVVVPSERGRWDWFYPAAAAAVRGEGPVPVDPNDAVATARIIDQARISAAEHRVVEV